MYLQPLAAAALFDKAGQPRGEGQVAELLAQDEHLSAMLLSWAVRSLEQSRSETQASAGLGFSCSVGIRVWTGMH